MNDYKSPSLRPLAEDLPAWNELANRLYTIPELMRITGMSRKQVNYWEDIGLLKPTFRDPSATGSRPAAYYAASDILKALIICELLARGCTLREVQQIALNLQEYGIHLRDSEAYLLTDGHSVYYAFSNNEVVDVHKHHRQRLLLVSIHEQVAKLQEAA